MALGLSQGLEVESCLGCCPQGPLLHTEGNQGPEGAWPSLGCAPLPSPHPPSTVGTGRGPWQPLV